MPSSTHTLALAILGLSSAVQARPNWGGYGSRSSTATGSLTTCSATVKTVETSGVSTVTEWKPTTVYSASVYSSPVPTTETSKYDTTILITKTEVVTVSKPYETVSTGYSYYATVTEVESTCSEFPPALKHERPFTDTPKAEYSTTTIISTIPYTTVSTFTSSITGSYESTTTVTAYSSEVDTSTCTETETSALETVVVGTGYSLFTTSAAFPTSTPCVETKPWTTTVASTESVCHTATAGYGW